METLNLQPPTMEWRVYRNDSSVMTLALVDSTDSPIDLTDWEFEGTVRQFPTDAEPLSELEIIKNQNVLTVGLDTSDLEQVNYFDIQGTNSVLDKVSTIARGQIFVEEDVTR